MLSDILSSDMYASFNVKLAHRIGLTSAVYLAELINIQHKAYTKNKITDNCFKVDRNYIERRTTLSKKDQYDLDEILCSLGVVKMGVENKDLVSLDLDAITGLLLDDRVNIESKVKAVTKRKRVTKQDVIKETLKASIRTTNEELREAYSEWIDTIFMRFGWMSKAAVLEGQDVIDNYTQKDLDLALAILKIGATNGYRDLSWAITKYEQRAPSRSSKSIEEATDAEVKPAIEFSDEVY